MPVGAVYVGRPTVFGNIFGGAGQEAVRAYREWIISGIEGRPAATGHFAGGIDAAAGYPRRAAVVDKLSTLKGKDLACWCPLDQPCHADVLLEIAN